ncbi:sensor histidine kinase KdpD [Kineosporia sp. R_H_3]|uniref:sensor histidine kinase n=1 Tax=Kineosporia sp. R_H_3 TaxID=1961848 RepID=UPI0018E9EAF1|nr:HAMP domain-containing sensor histidine kinase [Kineosporia sp. R_H_3]
MRIPDGLQVVLLALAWSGAVGLVGLLVVRLGPRRSVRSTLVATAVVGVASLVAGVWGAARAMFISEHDLGVVVQVSLAAGAVALAVAVVAGRVVVRDVVAVRRLARLTTADGPDGPDGPGGPGGDARADAPHLLELAEIHDELVGAGDRLAAARARERSLEASRRELVAWVSHDLRTPLAGVRAMAEALEDGLAPDPARYHRQILQEVDRLGGLVDDLFELSRLQAGTVLLDLAPLDLAALARDVTAAAAAGAAARDVTVAPVAHPGAVPVRGDGRALARVVGNLVANAVRYSAAGSSVRVDVRADVRIDVRIDVRADAGPGRADDGTPVAVVGVEDGCGGIAAADVERLFEPGWRASTARTPGADGGGGLGLAIARGVARAHGGDVTVGDAPGGCRFELRVPLAGPADGLRPGGAHPPR